MSQDAEALARRIHELEQRVAALGRSRQLSYSSLPVTVEDEHGDPVEVEVPLGAAVGSGVRAGAVAQEALEHADQAAQDALAAKTTADGRNRIYAQMVEPVTMPELPFVQGDLWYVLDSEGRFVSVRVWDGSIWKPYQLVAGSVLVPGSVGPVLIEDGAVTATKIAGDAIDGKTITGATMRTAPSGQRMQFDSDGLKAYDSAGGVTATLAAFQGGMWLAGNLASISGDREGWVQPSGLYSYVRDAGYPSGFKSVGRITTFENQSTLELTSNSVDNFTGSKLWGQATASRSALRWQHRPSEAEPTRSVDIAAESDAVRINVEQVPLRIQAFDGGMFVSGGLSVNSGRFVAPGNVFVFKSSLESEWSDAPDGARAWVSSENREYVRAGGAWWPKQLQGRSFYTGGNDGSSSGWIWNAQQTVSFGTTLPGIPVVTAQPSGHGSLYFASINAISTTGFTFRVVRLANAPVDGYLNWTATPNL